ncbi:MAG: chemotaxis protein CheW, partial [Aquabacterium sp.]|nr:chemotaxis protein CheW [Aquabacterium sp.]
ISGAQTELDKGVVEKLADPLTHLVRNAIDHGIESAPLREQAGKPARGTVRLHARHEAGQVVVEVADDGGGLSRERILQVSNLSGRGVGMDVVKRGIAALRGTVALRSRVGAGTTVSIRLPLTLAIIDGFLMVVGKSAYVVPLGAVSECVELARQDTDGRDWLDLRGEVLPLVRLRELYGVEGEAGRRQNVVVVQRAGQRVGLVVDQLMGELQTVIKPLGRVFQQVRGIAGFTILGNGSVALLLDIPSLVLQAVQESDQRCSHPGGPPAGSPHASMPGRRPTPAHY